MSRGRQRTIWTALLSGKQHTGHTIDPTDRQIDRQKEGRDHRMVMVYFAMMKVFFADGCIIQWVDFTLCAALLAIF